MCYEDNNETIHQFTSWFQIVLIIAFHSFFPYFLFLDKERKETDHVYSDIWIPGVFTPGIGDILGMGLLAGI